MGDKAVLDIQFWSSGDQNQARDGRGTGMLFLDGQPFWYANSKEDPKPIDWTWVDFLEHLAEVWPALIAEQSYPFSWLDKAALHPGEAWTLAEQRWARRGAALAYQEEPLLLDFYRRHNLAAAWKGMAVPALTCLRVGKSVWLSPEGSDPIRASFEHFQHALHAVGDQLSDAFKDTDNPRVANAVLSWKQRGDALRASFIELSTGFSAEEVRSLQGRRSLEEYWELPANMNWMADADAANDSVVLAAARMARPLLSPPLLANVIEIIRRVPKARTDALDEIGLRANAFLHRNQGSYPHESGYVLADWTRRQLNSGKYVDIAHVLTSYGVQVLEVNLFTEAIDALAFWVDHGPCILLNSARSYANNNKRTRMILAHELCHLLIDRTTALPVAEVLGGAIDQFVERRANAFAAELLLPRDSVEWEWGKLAEQRLTNLLPFLTTDYGISKAVAYAQIYNSSVFAELQRTDQDKIQARIMELDKEYQVTKVFSEVV